MTGWPAVVGVVNRARRGKGVAVPKRRRGECGRLGEGMRDAGHCPLVANANTHISVVNSGTSRQQCVADCDVPVLCSDHERRCASRLQPKRSSAHTCTHTQRYTGPITLAFRAAGQSASGSITPTPFPPPPPPPPTPQCPLPLLQNHSIPLSPSTPGSPPPQPPSPARWTRRPHSPAANSRCLCSRCGPPR